MSYYVLRKGENIIELVAINKDSVGREENEQKQFSIKHLL